MVEKVTVEKFFHPSTLVVPSQYPSTNASLTIFTLLLSGRRSLRPFIKSNVLAEIGEQWKGE